MRTHCHNSDSSTRTYCSDLSLYMFLWQLPNVSVWSQISICIWIIDWPCIYDVSIASLIYRWHVEIKLPEFEQQVVQPGNSISVGEVGSTLPTRLSYNSVEGKIYHHKWAICKLNWANAQLDKGSLAASLSKEVGLE